MPTKKPQLKTYVKIDTFEKFKLIADKENRSVSNMLEILVLEKIENYEKSNGTIKIQSITVNDNNGTINM